MAAFGKALGKPDAYADPALKESKDTYRVWDRTKGFTAGTRGKMASGRFEKTEVTV